MASLEDDSASTQSDAKEEDSETMAASVSKPDASDSLAHGILQLFQPSLNLIDERVECARESQLALREHIDRLTSDLQRLSEVQNPPVALEPYVKKLLNCRRRVMLVNGALQNTQERLNKLHQNITREATRKRLMDLSTTSS